MRQALFFMLISLSLFVSCRTPPLEVDLVYVGLRSLASYWVCTPDPQLCDPPLGQRLAMMWYLSSEQFAELKNPKLHLRVRFANQDEKSYWWDITRNKGKVIYSNVGTENCPVPPISTYRVEIVTEGKAAYCVEQSLWTEWIQLQGCVGERGEEGKQEEQEKNEKEEEMTPQSYVWDDVEEIRREERPR